MWYHYSLVYIEGNYMVKLKEWGYVYKGRILYYSGKRYTVEIELLIWSIFFFHLFSTFADFIYLFKKTCENWTFLYWYHSRTSPKRNYVSNQAIPFSQILLYFKIVFISVQRNLLRRNLMWPKTDSFLDKFPA